VDAIRVKIGPVDEAVGVVSEGEVAVANEGDIGRALHFYPL
jgi:hypothetical protein